MTLERATKSLKVALARLDGATFSHGDTIGEVSGKLGKARHGFCEALQLCQNLDPQPSTSSEELRKLAEAASLAWCGCGCDTCDSCDIRKEFKRACTPAAILRLYVDLEKARAMAEHHIDGRSRALDKWDAEMDKNQELKAELRGLNRRPVPGESCNCWHASNRGEIGETLQHPNNFHCVFCEDSGVVQHQVTFTKLQSGEWGVRGPSAALLEGTLVTVLRRDKTVKEILVGRRVWNTPPTRDRYAMAIHHIDDTREREDWNLKLDEDDYPIFHPY